MGIEFHTKGILNIDQKTIRVFMSNGIDDDLYIDLDKENLTAKKSSFQKGTISYSAMHFQAVNYLIENNHLGK